MDTRKFVPRQSGAELIAHEREHQRQRWGDDHDDEHGNQELARAAVMYAMPVNHRSALKTIWPFQQEFKPSQTRVGDLVKAGALIAAEIDRLQRKMDQDGE